MIPKNRGENFSSRFLHSEFDTIDSVLRVREVGRVKDLSAPPRMSVNMYGGNWNKYNFVQNVNAYESEL